MISANEALRRFEQRLVSQRSIAAQADAIEAYAAKTLPAGPIPPLLEQGFAAGFDAAMGNVRAALAAVQTDVLRDADFELAK